MLPKIAESVNGTYIRRYYSLWCKKVICAICHMGTNSTPSDPLTLYNTFIILIVIVVEEVGAQDIKGCRTNAKNGLMEVL